MNRHLSPSLLIAVDRFYRHSQKLRHLLLGLAQPPTDICEFFCFHEYLSIGEGLVL